MAATAEKLIEAESSDVGFDLDERHLSRLESRNRVLGELALGQEARLYNYDPLAHVFLRLEAERFADVEAQIEAEFRGDMSERSEITDDESEESDIKPFYNYFEYQLVDGGLIYKDTGKALNELLVDGLNAADADARKNKQNYQYHLDRARVLAGHGPAMAQWRQTDPETCAIIASLSPSADELDPKIAKLGNFKTHRDMASIWVLEPTTDGILMHVFSEDNLTLAGLQYIYDELGVEAEVHDTTLAEVGEIRSLPFKGGSLSVTKFTSAHNDRLDKEQAQPGERHIQGIKTNHFGIEDAYLVVESEPLAENLYKNVVEALAETWQAGRISPSLAEIIMELRRPFDGPVDIPEALRLSNPPTITEGRQFMKYLLDRALPEYIFGDNEAHQAYAQPTVSAEEERSQSRSDSYGDVAAAGSYAVEQGISREGSCPSSTFAEESIEHANASVAASLGLHSSKHEFESQWCPNCLPKPKPGKTVKAWRKGDKIGCGNCGHEVDVCTRRVTKKGRQLEKVKTVSVDLLEPIINWFKQQKLEQEIKRLRAEQAALGDNVGSLALKRHELELNKLQSTRKLN